MVLFSCHSNRCAGSAIDRLAFVFRFSCFGFRDSGLGSVEHHDDMIEAQRVQVVEAEGHSRICHTRNYDEKCQIYDEIAF